jgi:sterol desaturase/sphingolipid hydroxylase (fatty acid hydroxylase superfamily)
VRAFWLTLFAIGAATVLVFGWQDGVPFTAAAFVAFFVSRVWRSVIKRPLSRPRHNDPVRRANRFIVVTAVGYLAAGLFAGVAAVVGEGQEWLYVAPCFLIMGTLQLALLSSRRQS